MLVAPRHRVLLGGLCSCHCDNQGYHSCGSVCVCVCVGGGGGGEGKCINGKKNLKVVSVRLLMVLWFNPLSTLVDKGLK